MWISLGQFLCILLPFLIQVLVRIARVAYAWGSTSSRGDASDNGTAEIVVVIENHMLRALGTRNPFGHVDFLAERPIFLQDRLQSEPACLRYAHPD